MEKINRRSFLKICGVSAIAPAALLAGEKKPKYYEGGISHILLFKRCLSDNEIKELHKNPFDMFTAGEEIRKGKMISIRDDGFAYKVKIPDIYDGQWHEFGIKHNRLSRN